MKYYIKTFGCQLNISDSERIAGFLESHKFKLAKNINEADLIIFNTCGVRQSAEDRVYGQIHNLRKSEIRSAKFETKRKIILTGCLANRKDVRRRLNDKVDLFCEIKEFPIKVSGIMYQVLSMDREPEIHNTSSDKYQNYLEIEPKYNTRYSAYIPIMTGCNNFCSYCVVPYARGREVSRPAQEVLNEIKKLIKNGYKEIVLLGQNVNSYKSKVHKVKKSTKQNEIINFSKLLRKINDIPGNFWISFISNHPKDVTDEMIETVAKCEKVCECFHLPIQAGNDEVIRKMNRKYTAKEYLKKVDKIKKAYQKYKPGALYSITSDIIVGFPGETKKQFLDSAEVMKKTKFDMVYFGQYSPRPGTTSWKMKDNVSKKEKTRREKYLNKILKKTSLENNKKYVGKVLEILVDNFKVEPWNKKGSTFIYFGQTRTMKNVKFKSDKIKLVGKFVKVKITKANIWNLEGILIEM